MDINRTMQHKPRAVRKLLDSYSSEEVQEGKRSEEKFKFPPPPRLPLPHFSPPPFVNASDVDTSDSQSDQASRNNRRHYTRVRIPPGRSYAYRGYQSDGSPARLLPPIGVFWDIENCQIPRGRSAVAVAQAIRDRFFDGYQEAEFLVVCDVKKESSQVIQELNDAQVNLIHVGATSKNAADEKLRHSMRRFADIHGFPAAIVLISGDINFAPDLCDLRHRKKIYMILVHNEACSESLILCANEHYSFNDLVELLPLRGYVKAGNQQPVEIIVRNLPRGPDVKKIRRRLKYLSENCGGRVGYITESTANIRFPSVEFAMRAQKRLDGELVFGNQISVGFPQRIASRNEPLQNGRGDVLAQQTLYSNSLSSSYGSQPDYGSPQWFSPAVLSAWNGTTNGPRNPGNIHRPQPQCATLLNNQENILSAPKQTAWDQAPWIWHYSNGDASTQAKSRSVLTSRNDKCPEENTWNPNFPINLKADHGNREVGNNGTVPKASASSLDTSNRVEAILKRTRVSSPRSTRRSLDSMRLPTSKSNGALTGRKCRTPSPYTVLGNSISAENLSVLPRKVMSFPNEPLENEKYFSPIPSANPTNSNIELHVTNLDQSIEPKEMKKILVSAFGEHVMVHYVSVFMQSDGNYAACVKLRSLQDAQYAISQLHRKKIGFKRIMIYYAHSSQQQNPQFIRWQIVSLLQEVPGHKLPLFKFLELYESRYLSTVSVSDLYRLKDVCIISDESVGRMVTLNPDHRNTPSPNLVPTQDIEPYCSIHYKGIQCLNKGWAEQEAVPPPNVMEALSTFSSNIMKLLNVHNNILPLVSLCDCYEAICGELNVNESGVPMEHYVTCVNGVELALSNGIKYLKPGPPRSQDEKQEDGTKSVSPSLVNQLTLFGRELVDLLKTQPHCQLMFNKFVPAYHHHFGRQCRVADYGFTKLIELLDALPNIVQVIGEGSKRIVTLSHKAQLRRFTLELLRVLKAQPCKKMNLSELPQLFERTLNRPFDPVDYGLCQLEDLVQDIRENTIVITKNGSDFTLAILKREQTTEEIEKTKLFAKEVIELLSHAPQCSILFNKFIPAYHHHYGHQCRVADFGFSKLIELFEAIPDIVKLDEDCEGERRVSLTNEQKLKVLGEQISELVIDRYPPGLALSLLNSAFLRQFGYALKPENYQAISLEELVSNIKSVELVNLECGLTLVPVDQAKIEELTTQILLLLMKSSSGKMTLTDIKSLLNKCYHHYLTPDQIKSFLNYAIQIEGAIFGTEIYIALNSLYQFARKVYHLLLENDGYKLALSSLEEAYVKSYSICIQPALYSHSSVASLLSAIPKVVTMRGKRPKRVVILNKDFTPCKGQMELSPKVKSLMKAFSSKNDLSDFESGANINWNNKAFDEAWQSFQGYDGQVPVITLPEMATPPENIMNMSDLISPCKNLLEATIHPMLHSEPLPYLMAPDPSELPIPKKYLTPILEKEEDLNRKRNIDEFSATPRINNDDYRMEMNSQSLDAKDRDTPNSATKRKLRLAAQFQTPIEFP